MHILGYLVLAVVFTIITSIIFIILNRFSRDKMYILFLEKKLSNLYSPLYYYANKTIFNLTKEDFKNLNEIIKNNIYLSSEELPIFLIYFIKSNPSYDNRQKKGKLGALFNQVNKDFKELSNEYNERYKKLIIKSKKNKNSIRNSVHK